MKINELTEEMSTDLDERAVLHEMANLGPKKTGIVGAGKPVVWISGKYDNHNVPRWKFFPEGPTGINATFSLVDGSYIAPPSDKPDGYDLIRRKYRRELEQALAFVEGNQELIFEYWSNHHTIIWDEFVEQLKNMKQLQKEKFIRKWKMT